MKIDLVIKLIRLANNNPNDNEANAAARRVCRELADYKFTLASNTSSNQSQRPQPQQQQSNYSKRPRRNPFEGFDFDYQSIFDEVEREQQRIRREREAQEEKVRQARAEYEKQEKKRKQTADDYLRSEEKIRWERRNDYINVDPNFNPSYTYTPKGRVRNTEIPTRTLKCTVCGTDTETRFVGAPEVFQCNTCQWTAYEREKKV